MATDRRSSIEEAYRSLPLLPEIDDATVGSVVDCMVLLTNDAPAAADTPFRNAGQNSTRGELDALAKRLDSLAEAIDNLHQPAILALADQQGIMRTAFGNPDQIREIAGRVKAVDVSALPREIDRGASTSVRRAHAIAKCLAADFLHLTGKKPTISFREADSKAYGPFLALISAVFAAGEIKGSPESSARIAMAFWSGK